MALFIKKDSAKEFIDAGWEVDYSHIVGCVCKGFHIYPRAKYLLALPTNCASVAEEVEVTPDDVHALRLLDVGLWNSYLLPLRQEQNK